MDTIPHQQLKAERSDRTLTLADAKDRLKRLTDFLLDGTLDRKEYQERRETLQVEVAQREEELRTLNNGTATAEDIEKFFELMKSLAALYVSAKPSVKRGIVENCFSNRTWNGEYIEMEPSKQLVQARSELLAPSGGGTRDTFRTFIELLEDSNDDGQSGFAE